MAGPKVFLDYDQAALDAAYEQTAYAANRDQLLGRYASASELTRRRLGPPERFAYGSTEIERVDVYPAAVASAPVEIFVHGGAWRGGLARDYAFPAETFVRAGIHFAVLDFVPIQDAPDGLATMVDQLRRALAWLYTNATRFGGDPDQLYLSGFSSGGHLAGVLLTTDWHEFGLPADIIKGGLCASGIYDLKPIRLSARSSYVKLDDAMEHALSPQRQLAKLHAPLIIASGTLETPEFIRHAREFSAAVAAAGKPVEALVLEGYNHFEAIETLANPYGILGCAALKQIAARAR
jgi:arylformamidase